MIMPQKEQINLPEEMVYLLNSQIEEADAIVLNKIDLLSDEETDKYVKFLETNDQMCQCSLFQLRNTKI